MMERVYRRQLPIGGMMGPLTSSLGAFARGQEELESRERDLVASAIRSFDGERYQPLAYVVMDDHVHALVWPFPAHGLDGIVHSWKSFSAHQMQRRHGRFGRTSILTGSFATRRNSRRS
jgi:hypothetical protein